MVLVLHGSVDIQPQRALPGTLTGHLVSTPVKTGRAEWQRDRHSVPRLPLCKLGTLGKVAAEWEGAFLAGLPGGPGCPGGLQEDTASKYLHP